MSRRFLPLSLSRTLAFALGSFALVACTSQNDSPDGGGSPAGSDLATAGDMALPPHTKLIRLVSSDYDIMAASETYQCQRITVPSDMYILRVTPVSPTGVHHEVLAIDPNAAAPDGVSHCGPLDPSWHPLFASGVGSPSLQMPPGVALQVAAKSQIVLDLHLFNAKPTGNITGTAAIDVLVADSNDGYQIAQVPFVGNLTFTIGANETVKGTCTVQNDTSFFAVFPHMHLTGKHILISAGKTGSETVVWDQDYDFNEQKFGIYPDWQGPPSVALKKGDHINVTCSYTPAGIGKSFGDSTTDEMCFAISYVTPAIKTFMGTPFCGF